jgi:hypothetical protein
MNYSDEKEVNTDLRINIKRDIIAKNGILDENFKKAEVQRKYKKQCRYQIKNKPFLKSGIAVILIAFLCLAIINFIPWLYFKHSSVLSDDSYLEGYFFKDFNTEDKNSYGEITNFFYSGNSSKLIGLSENDFIVIPLKAMYTFFALILLGVAFTVFEILDRKKNFLSEKVSIVQSFFSGCTIIICLFIIYLLIEFLGAHLLVVHNFIFISQSLPEIVLIFPAPIILIFISAGIIKVAFTILKINFKDLVVRLEEESIKSLHTYRYGGKD